MTTLGKTFALADQNQPVEAWLTRGKLADFCGVNRETIRYYERMGLVSAGTQTESGYHLFPTSSVARVQFIRKSQAVGFSLDEIRVLLDLKFDSAATCGDVREIVQAKIETVEQKIALLVQMKETLVELADDCPGGTRPVEECPILETFSEPSHP